MREIQIPEVRCFYGFQIAMENIHSETYCQLIESFVEDSNERKKLLNAIVTVPSVKKKAEWAIKWTQDPKANLATRLVAYAAVEGILFSGSFCAIFWIKKQGKMPGLTYSNELISRDEGMHTDFSCLLYSMLEKRLSQQEVHCIIQEALDIEKEYIEEALPIGLVGMNSKLMSQYLEFVADRLIWALGYEKIYNVQNPFEWMDLISLPGKTNFFERRVGEYQKYGVMVENKEENVFRVDLPF